MYIYIYIHRHLWFLWFGATFSDRPASPAFSSGPFFWPRLPLLRRDPEGVAHPAAPHGGDLPRRGFAAEGATQGHHNVLALAHKTWLLYGYYMVIIWLLSGYYLAMCGYIWFYMVIYWLYMVLTCFNMFCMVSMDLLCFVGDTIGM